MIIKAENSLGWLRNNQFDGEKGASLGNYHKNLRCCTSAPLEKSLPLKRGYRLSLPLFRVLFIFIVIVFFDGEKGVSIRISVSLLIFNEIIKTKTSITATAINNNQGHSTIF